jgi:hypothetical protein
MSGSRGEGVPPGPDGRHDDLVPDDLDGLSLGIPDDPRELTADLERWRREELTDPATDPATPPAPVLDRQVARRTRLTITAGVVLVSMVIVALSGAIGAWIVAPQAASPPAAPLSSGGPEPGQLGGLLPEAPLSDGTSTLSSQSLRPAVVVLVPETCDDCVDLLASAAPQVASFGVRLVAVGESGDQVSALVDAVDSGTLTGLVDPDGRLRATYGATGTVMLLVRDDGVVVDIVSDPVPDVRLDGALVDLVPATTT